MAYISKILSTDEFWCGPYPNKAGESCGNVHRSCLTISEDGVVLKDSTGSSHFILMEEFDVEDDEIPSKRIGRPASCKMGSSEQMESMGYVGLYLIRDSKKNLDRGVEVETDILMEEVVSGLRPPSIPFDPGVPMNNEI